MGSDNSTRNLLRRASARILALEWELRAAPAYLHHVARVEVGSILTKQGREVVSFCAHWLDNGLHVAWGREVGFREKNPIANDHDRIRRSPMGSKAEAAAVKIHDMTGCSLDDARALIPMLMDAMEEIARGQVQEPAQQPAQQTFDDGPKEKNESPGDDEQK